MKRRSAQLGTVEHLPSRVAAYLRNSTREGQLKAGDRIPTEHQISAELGVSRNVVREAISQLRADGVIESRQGVGSFVADPRDRNVIRLDPQGLSDGAELGQFFELRIVIETKAARIAASLISDEGIARLHLALARMRGAERHTKGSVDADLDFHMEIARATDNDYFQTFVNFMLLQIRHSIYLARRSAPINEIVESTTHEHADILAAIESRNPRAAEEAMRFHLMGSALRAGAAMAGRYHGQDD
jgi:GntR family transcriptional regulator, transcriptional repressor for pyruvate dehydrogenase complex